MSQNFIVQYLGCEAVSKPKGVDHVLEPLQRLSSRASGIHLVELVVSPAGFTINDPQKRDFISKHVPIKKVTYCVRVRSVLYERERERERVRVREMQCFKAL